MYVPPTLENNLNYVKSEVGIQVIFETYPMLEGHKIIIYYLKYHKMTISTPSA